MKANWFRLQSILDLRASALEGAQNILAQARAKLGAAETAFDGACAEANRIADGICSAAATLTAAEFHSARQWHLYQTRQAEVFRLQVGECQKTVQKCLVQVVNASREHEILARFREKSLAVAQALEAQKEENALNDLINSQRFQKQRPNHEEIRTPHLSE